ncbi:MAG: DUF3108 domain-containing protein [Bacteriovoracaceae bacterium]
MKFGLIGLLLLISCSSWKQKDFEKEVNKAPESAAPEVNADKKLLERFEVITVADPTPAQKASTKKVEIKKGKPNNVKVVAPITPVAAKKTIPPEMVDINNKAKKVWNLYRSNHYENDKLYLDIHYLGMTVGKIMVMNRGKKMINGKEVWHLHARFKSAPFYSHVYELDDTVDTYVTTDQFLSIRYSLIQRESKQDIDDLQLHDRDNFTTFWFYKQKKSDGSIKEKKEEKPIPFYSIDPFSVVFFYQGLPLKDKDVYEIPLINKGKILILKSVVEGREVLDTELGKKRAIRVHATTQYTGETFKSGDLYFWFSDDHKRALLSAKAKIKIGSVTADIVKE